MPEVVDKTPHQQLIEQKPVQPGTEDLTQVPEDFAGFSKWRAEGGNTEVPEAPEPPQEEGKTADETEPSKAEQDKDRDNKGRFKPQASEVPIGVQKRIDKAIAKQREAERERDELREWKKTHDAQAAAPAVVPTPAAQPAKPDDQRPKQESFSTYEEFTEAVADWKVRQILASERAKEAEARKQQEANNLAELRNKKRRESVEAAQAKYADFDEVVADLPNVPQPIVDAAADSDSPAELAYYFAKNPSELERILSLPIERGFVEIGKIEAKLTAPPAPVAQPKTTQAPPPPSPVQARATGSSFSENDEGGTADEWARKRNEQVYKRRR